MSVEIRRVRVADGGFFGASRMGVFDAPVDGDRLGAYLAAPGHLMVVAVADGIVVGQAAGVVHRHPDKPTELYVDEVGVAPSHQRQGIARKMLDELFAIGRELGCEEAWVGTEPDNLPARKLYESRPEAGEPAQDFVMYVYAL